MSDTPPPSPSGGTTVNIPPLGNMMSGLVPHRSVGLKLILVCFLALLMAIPALFVFAVTKDRESGRNAAFAEVSESVGGQQSVLGPVLALPYARTPDPKRTDRVVYGIAIAYAETGGVQGTVNVEERSRGIHDIPVYEADLQFDAVFDPANLRRALPSDAEPIWSDARVYMGVSDTRGIRDVARLTVNGKAVKLEPMTQRYVDAGQYTSVPMSQLPLAGGAMPMLETAAGPLKVSASLQLSGADRLAIGPFAQDTRVTLASNWDDPSFQGGILPSAHTASDPDVTGFEATWNVPYLARGIEGSGADLDLNQVTEWNRREMATRFMQLTNPYTSVERALKYAIMFIGFVFLAWFLFEITSKARAHPAQYVLVGLAQSMFYILLLAFAEQIGFDLAFMIAASMTVLLISAYAMSVFRSKTYGLRALGILTGIYGLIYVLMRAEDHALLAGALASFAAIALTMFMTRNIDWYGGREKAV